jgi:hypothetical protein
MWGWLFNTQPRRRRQRGLIGGLMGGNQYYSRPQRGLIGGLFGGNQYYAQPRRRGLLSNPIVGALAVGALGYAANRFLGGQQRSQGGMVGGNQAGDTIGGGSTWDSGAGNSSGGSFDQGNGQSW